MDDMESKLNSILGNPQMMQQIMSMAQALGQTPQQEEKPPEPAPEPQPSPLPATNDMAMLQRLYAVARQSGVDKNQQALLKALSPYLSHDRIGKLEKAMRAAKIAGLATTVLGSSGLALFSGR